MQVENRSASSFNTAMQATGYGNHTAMPTHWNNNVQDFLITFLMYNGRLQNEKKKDKVYKGGSSQGWGLQSPRECHEGVFLSTRDTAFTRINSIGTICTTFDSFFFLFLLLSFARPYSAPVHPFSLRCYVCATRLERSEGRRFCFPPLGMRSVDVQITIRKNTVASLSLTFPGFLG